MGIPRRMNLGLGLVALWLGAVCACNVAASGSGYAWLGAIVNIPVGVVHLAVYFAKCRAELPADDETEADDGERAD